MSMTNFYGGGNYGGLSDWRKRSPFGGQNFNYGGNGGGYGGNDGNIFSHMANPNTVNFGYNQDPFIMSQSPEYSKPREFKEPNPWLTGGMLGGGLLGMIGSAFGGPSNDNPFEFAKGYANKFGAQADDFMNPNNQFVKSQKSMAQGTGAMMAQQGMNNLNKQFAANGLQGGNMLAKQGQRQMYGQGLDQANQLGNQAYKDSLGMAQNMYQKQLEYNQMFGQGEELKRQAGMGRQSSFGDMFGTIAGQGLGLFSSIFG